MARWRAARFAFAGAIATALMVPAGAQGTVTIGSNLSSTPAITLTNGPWTVFQDPLGSQFQAAGGLVSPMNGTITQWRLRVGNAATPTTLRVIRTLGGGLYTGAGTSSTVTPNLNVLNTFPTQLPIKIGDRIGIDCCANPGAAYFSDNPTGTRKEIKPLLVDGGPGQSTVQTGSREILLNADIEPDVDGDVFGDETQDKCVGTPGTFNGCPNTLTLDKLRQKGAKPKVKVTATVPGAGTLAAGSPSDPALASAASKRNLKPVTETLTSTTKQQVVLTLKLSKSAKRKLAEKGKLRAQVKVLYTPPGGPAGSQTGKVKLKS